MTRRTDIPSPPSERPVCYILKDGKPVPERDLHALGVFIVDYEARNVGHTILSSLDGTEIRISTDFMCVNARFGGGDPPLLWETIVFWPGNKEWDGWQEHYASMDDARAGHETTVALVKAALADKQ
jgi:hypothetical protein